MDTLISLIMTITSPLTNTYIKTSHCTPTIIYDFYLSIVTQKGEKKKFQLKEYQLTLWLMSLYKQDIQTCNFYLYFDRCVLMAHVTLNCTNTPSYLNQLNRDYFLHL